MSNNDFVLYPLNNPVDLNNFMNQQYIRNYNINTQLPPNGVCVRLFNQQDSGKLLHLKNSNINAIPVTQDSVTNVDRAIERKLSGINISNELDLSNIAGEINNINDRNTNGYVLFSAGNFISKNNPSQLQQITSLRFCDNNISDKSLPMFNKIKTIFPNLQNLDISGNPLRNRLKLPGVNVVQNIQAELSTTSNQTFYESRGFSEPIIWKPLDPPQPLKVNPISDVVAAIDGITLDSFTPCNLDPNSFVTHPFIIEFLDRSWSSLNTIGLMYADEAQFSYSIGPCIDGSPLHKLAENARDFMNPDSVTNIAMGPANILMLQKYLFGTGFYAHPTFIHSTCIGENLFGTLIYGGFRDNSDHVFRFNRSLTIGNYPDGFKIMNDQIHIQNPSHAKLSSFNIAEAQNIIRDFMGTK